VSLRARLAARLERGLPLPFLWPPVSRVVAKVAKVPSGCKVVCVGGSTLGGSSRTPTAIELARALVDAGMSVAYLAHGYAARARRPTQVFAHSNPNDAGDEAVLAASMLGERVQVWHGGSRTQLLQVAARGSKVLIVDGTLQLAPQRAACSVLALDAEVPWSSGQGLPFGDLRARPEALLSACDLVLCTGLHARPASESLPALFPEALPEPRPKFFATERVHVDGVLPERYGLFASIARPERMLRSMQASGLPKPTLALRGEDHRAQHAAGAITRHAERLGLQDWLVTAKCQVLLDGRAELRHLRLHVLRHELELPSTLVEAVKERLR
jgi:tetraacyldisaccharide 4'-kinase